MWLVFFDFGDRSLLDPSFRLGDVGGVSTTRCLFFFLDVLGDCFLEVVGVEEEDDDASPNNGGGGGIPVDEFTNSRFGDLGDLLGDDDGDNCCFFFVGVCLNNGEVYVVASCCCCSLSIRDGLFLNGMGDDLVLLVLS